MAKRVVTKKQTVVEGPRFSDAGESLRPEFGIAFTLLTIIVFVWIIRRIFRPKRLGKRSRWQRSDYIVLHVRSNGTNVYEHRVVAANVLGRDLFPGEVVHHINFIKSDNRAENLCVMNETAHRAFHDWHDWIVKTYGRYPLIETQERKLQQKFGGILLSQQSSGTRTRYRITSRE